MGLDCGGKNKRITIAPHQEPRYCSFLFYFTTYTSAYYLIGAVYSTFLLLLFATTRVYQQYRYHAKVILLNKEFCVTVRCLLVACLFEGYIASYAHSAERPEITCTVHSGTMMYPHSSKGKT